MENESAISGQSYQFFAKTITKDITCNYILFLPEDYGRERQKWPLILFLHGMGERGDDLERVKTHGPPKIVESRKDFPFVVVSPQCPEDKWWSECSEMLIYLLDEIESKYEVDKQRVYLTGLSMGGFGTWKLAAEYPERFAAIAPICGGGDPFWLAHRLGNMPIWVFHGKMDEAVPIKNSEDIVEELRKNGANVRFTVYPDAGHDCWTQTYENQELYDWFLEHRSSSENGG